MKPSERTEVIARLEGYLDNLVERRLKRPASEAGAEKAEALNELVELGTIQVLIDNLKAGAERSELDTSNDEGTVP